MKSRLFAAACLGLVVFTFTLDAQQKKEKPPTAQAGTVEIYKNKEGEYRYRVKNAEGKTVAMPLPQMSWESKADVLKALAELKSILNSPPVDGKDAEPAKVEKDGKGKKTEAKKAVEKK